jgi:hypothetical protein
LSPSFTRPIATPATAPLIGMPACISASDAPQTVAIEDDPFDSRMSETTRSVYGDSSSPGSTASIARHAKRAVADLAAADAGHAANFTHRERREVVVQHEALLLAFVALHALRVVGRAQRRETSACVSPRVNSAEPCTRGSTPTSIVTARIWSNARWSGRMRSFSTCSRKISRAAARSTC